METGLILLVILAVVLGLISVFLGTLFISAKRDLGDKTQRLVNQELELRTALDAKARAEQDAKRLPDAEQQLDGVRDENTQLREQVAALKKEREADQEKIQWSQRAEEELRDAFKVLASDALQGNADQFLSRARQQLGNIVEPLGKTLEEMDKQVRELEQKREGSSKGIEEQLRQLGQTHRELQMTTTTLVQALKSSGVRGRWGEVQLRRVIEMAGMLEHVDFVEQAATDEGRPDMIVQLPNKGILPVDAKTPMQAYLEAMEASEENIRNAKLNDHARAMRQRILELGNKRYWEQFERTPEIVAMFVPNESCMGAAFERAPDLLEFAIQLRVLPTTPVTLLALLKAVAYGWQQQQMAENARQIAAQGKELYDRLSTFISHLGDLGDRLNQAVRDYNEAIGSLESRVLPSARRMREMGVGSDNLPSLEPVDRQVRLPNLIEVKKTE